ncbi:MAG: MoaD/ThiS family protein [Proteobacteria bacterium]|nr:MoaD/ThiS family protein [Pseudomonadota bacterium]NIS67630.1 MoaD/ThiS family protein [Pseudomonadota bacterium]
MEIEVKLFANFRDYLPKGSDRFSSKIKVDASKRVADVLRKLGLPEDYPKIILINGVHAKENDKLKDGDVLSVFPPVAGGQGKRGSLTEEGFPLEWGGGG